MIEERRRGGGKSDTDGKKEIDCKKDGKVCTFWRLAPYVEEIGVSGSSRCRKAEQNEIFEPRRRCWHSGSQKKASIYSEGKIKLHNRF